MSTANLPPPASGLPPPCQFARLQVMPGCWVVRAEDPITYALGTTYRSFRVCLDRAHAPVFVAAKAREIQQGLARLFPTSELEPATFEEWIEQQSN